MVIFHYYSALPLSNDMYCYFDYVELSIDNISYNDSHQDHIQPVSEDNTDITLSWWNYILKCIFQHVFILEHCIVEFRH